MSSGFVLTDQIAVRAPIERCFRLSTNLQIVQEVLKMQPVRGRTSGQVRAGDTVRWEGWQLGLPQVHESLIEAFAEPSFFRDRMMTGRFAWFEHDHQFIAQRDGTVLLRDEVRFALRFGWLGARVGRWLIAPHIRHLMRRRFARLKELAEGDGWRRYLIDRQAAITLP